MDGVPVVGPVTNKPLFAVGNPAITLAEDAYNNVLILFAAG